MGNRASRWMSSAPCWSARWSGRAGARRDLGSRDSSPTTGGLHLARAATSVSHEALSALTVTGHALALRMPGGHGLVLDPSHEVGFELFPGGCPGGGATGSIARDRQVASRPPAFGGSDRRRWCPRAVGVVREPPRRLFGVSQAQAQGERARGWRRAPRPRRRTEGPAAAGGARSGPPGVREVRPA